MLGRGPAGVVANFSPSGSIRRLYGFRTTPAAAAGCCLPPLSEEGSLFSCLRVPPRGMRGSSENRRSGCPADSLPCRDLDNKAGTHRNVVLHVNVAFVIGNDATGDGQSQAGAPSFR